MDQENLRAVVEMRIKNDIKIYDDAIASIKTEGLIGDKYLSIDPGGGGDLLKPNGVITDTQAAVDVEQLISKYAFGELKKVSANNNKDQDKNKDKKSPKVLVLMGLPGSYIVATDNSYVGSLVKLAGGTNVYGDGGGEEFLTANTEDMQTKDPDIILRAAHALPDEVKEMFAEEFETNDVWKHFRAVQNGKVYDLDSSLFNMSANFSYSDALEALQPLLYGDE